MTNRVAVDKPLMVRSVNGPQFTIIEGAKARARERRWRYPVCIFGRCASLSGFSLTNGATRLVNDGPAYRESTGAGVL